MSWRDTFVGRGRELAELADALDAVAAGCGRVVMVVGEAGIGKTRTLTHFLGQARRGGALVLRGACLEGEWAGGYRPLAAALGEYVRAADLEQLRDDLSYGAAPLVRIVPALRERLGQVPEPVPLAPEEEQLRLFEAAGAFLVAISLRRPVVLFVDDLHLAGRDTLAMLRHVAHFAADHRLLVLGAYREEDLDETHVLGQLLPALRREVTYESIHLSGLRREEVEELARRIFAASAAHAEAERADFAAPLGERRTPFVEAALGMVPMAEANPVGSAARGAGGRAEWDAIVDRIHRESAGNPLFVWEMSLDLLEQAEGDPGAALQLASDGQLGVPRGVREVIERRQAKLSAEANLLLTAAAACHGSFRFDVVAEVAGLDEEAALEALDAGMRARLLRPASGSERYEFIHALIRRGVLERLNPSRQVRLHRDIALAMERIGGDQEGDHAAEIAFHYHRSASLPGAEGGVAPALSVAERAERRGAFDQAATFLRIASDLLPSGDPRRPAAMGRLGFALAWTLEFDQAMPIIEEASTLLAVQDPDAAIDYLADATRVLTIAGYQRGGWLCAERGLALASNRRDRAWVWLKAHDITRCRADDPDDPGLLTETPDVREIIEVVRRIPLAAWERLFLTNYVAPHTRDEVFRRKLRDVAALPCYDDQSFALEVLREGVAQSEREGRIGVMVYYLACLARALTANGDLPAAQAALDRAKTVAARMPYPSIQGLIVLAADNDLRLARDEGLEDMLGGAAAQAARWAREYHWAMAAVRAAAARSCASVGRIDDALALLEKVPRALEAAPPWITIYTKTACDAAAALWLLGRTDHVDRIDRCLREKVLPGDLRDYLREVRLSLAQTCALRERYEEARAWFAEARHILDQRGARTLRAIVDYDEALMFARRSEPGDGERAAALGQEALRQFRILGMTGWVRRVKALLEPAPHGERPHQPPDAEIAADRFTPRGEAIFRREGDLWRIDFAGREIHLRDSKGLHYLACLLYCPRREIHATDLVRLATGTPGGCRSAAMVGAEACVRADLGDAGPSVDARAAAAYQQRLEELRDELREAERDQDIGRAERSREEIAFLAEQLSGAPGHKIASHAERARVTVTKGIGAALERIRAAHPQLGEHLAASIRRGYFCSYNPDPRLPMTWQS